MKLDGIHHISAITGDARRNVDFYTRVLGLRLVAKSVNQDDPSVYHLFYGDEVAHPGADMTFFEYPYAKPGRAGAGMVHTIVWRLGSPAALDFWAARLAAEGVEHERGERSLRLTDPEGLAHELVVTDSPDEPLIAEHPEIPAELALQGFEGVRAYGKADRSRTLLENVMNATRREESRFELRGNRRGGWIVYDPPPAARGVQGGGSVHHVAWGTTMAEHAAWQARLADAGAHVTPVIDRHYFHSIYFREPNGVLFEIATLGPGVATDEDPEHLGEKLVLPPRFESLRDQIERTVTPIRNPREDWAKTE
jgi:glyoxalase family protein